MAILKKLILLCAGMLALIFMAPAHAATFTVTKIADTNDGACNADCSLREAIAAANSAAGADTIKFDATVFATPQKITVNSELILSTDIAVIGQTNSSAGLTVSGVSASSFIVFHVKSGTSQFTGMNITKGTAGIENEGTATATNCTLSGNGIGISNGLGLGISNSTITATNCTLSGNGVGIDNNSNKDTAILTNCILSGNDLDSFNHGTLTLTNCTLSGSRASIGNSGTLTLSNCTLSGDTGSAIFANTGSVTATNCTLSGNQTGISSDTGGSATLINCTLRGSTSVGATNRNATMTAINCTLSGNGGGISNIVNGTLTVTNCTLSGNTGAGIYSDNTGTVTLKNTIVAGNNTTNVSGAFTDGGHNITSGTAADAGLEVDGNGNPVLKNNGGPTQTIALLDGGAAVNAGDNALIPNGIVTDQRGSGFPRISGGTVDIGAFELQPVPISVNNPRSVPEGGVGSSGSVTFDITLSAASTQTVTVNYQTHDGTNNPATAGSDYTAKHGKLTFAPGETSKSVTIQFRGDSTAEPNETFFLDLSAPTNATIADSRGVGQINNDDGPSLSIADAPTHDEGSAPAPGSTNFTVTLSQALTQTVTVRYQTTDGSAIQNQDYVAKRGTLTFAPGETTKLVSVSFVGDGTAERNESFYLDLSSPVGVPISDSRGIATIRNDDGPSLNIADAAPVNEGNSGTTAQAFTVTLSAPSTNTVRVDWRTANGTADAGDYNPLYGTLVFSPGQLTKTIYITVLGDTTFEPTETYTLNLSNASYAAIADGQGIGTIRNDDPMLQTSGPGEPSQ